MTKQREVVRRRVSGLLFVAIATIMGGYNAQAQYVPPPDQKAPTGPNTSAGSRGGCGAEAGVEIIAPRSHVGRSMSKRPVLVWKVESPQKELELSIYSVEGVGTYKGSVAKNYPDLW